MFGAERLLGTLVSTGLGGIGQRPDFERAGAGGPSASAFTRAASGGVGQMASLALLGTLAYKAYQGFQQSREPQAPQLHGTAPSTPACANVAMLR